MKNVLELVGLVLGCAVTLSVIAFSFGTGWYYLVQTEYPYWSTIGGFTLCVATVGAIIGFFIWLDNQ